MSSLAIGFVGLGLVLVLIALRVPIAIVLTVVSIVGTAAIRGWAVGLGQLRSVVFDFVANWSLTAVPMFLLMGAVAHHSGISANLFAAARLWLARLPGGLAIAANLACAGFSAASGSSLATAAAMGRLAIPEMLRYRYDPGLAAGVVASAGTLGSMIPPSILFILYGIFAEQSITALLIAGIFPGILTALVYTVMIYVRCRLDPSLAPMVAADVNWRERFAALAGIWPVIILVVGIVGGLYAGVFTPTEAGAVGSSAAFLIALVLRRLSPKVIRYSVLEALDSTASLFFVAIGAVLFARFLTISGVPIYLGEAVNQISTSPMLLLICTSAVYVVLGMFLDSIGLMLITLPLFLPIFKSFHFDMVWFGVLVVKFCEIGLLTPPVGLNVYVIKSVVGDEIPLETIFRGVVWFLVCEVVIVFLLISFPEISLFLPNMMSGRG
jgi:tripartite ATP-independent transporter DctM subunit